MSENNFTTRQKRTNSNGNSKHTNKKAWQMRYLQKKQLSTAVLNLMFQVRDIPEITDFETKFENKQILHM